MGYPCRDLLLEMLVKEPFHFDIRSDFLAFPIYEKQTFDSERESILFLIDFQIKDVFLDIGLKMTTICFKNQINAENTYLHSDERYLYQKLLENLNNIQHMNKEHAAKMMLRISRGSIYDWCCHNGSYDLIEAVHEEISIVLDYIGL